MAESVDASGGCQPRRQGCGHSGIQHRYIRQEVVRQELHLHLALVVGDYRHQCSLRTGACCGRDHNKGQGIFASDNLTAHVLHNVIAALGDDNAQAFGGIDDRAAADGDDGVTFLFPEDPGGVVDHLNRGISWNISVDCANADLLLGKGFDHCLHQPDFLEHFVGEDNRTAGLQII